MAEKALQGVKVIELAKLVSGPYCAKLLADLAFGDTDFQREVVARQLGL